jgi:hypothetical protein
MSSNETAGTYNGAWAGAGTFTPDTSTLKMTGASKNINYTGDETIGHLHIDAGQTTLNNLSVSDGTDTFTCSSILIDSGTTFTTTSGTTTITSESSPYVLDWHLGTFNHNFGTVKLTTDADTEIYVGTASTDARKFYNLIINSPTASNRFTWKCGANDTRNFVVLGDLTITSGKLKAEAPTRGCEIYGNTHIGADGMFNYAGELESAADNKPCVFHGLVTNYGTFRPATTDGATLNGGIRQLGTLGA